jgi:hypothetical protein
MSRIFAASRPGHMVLSVNARESKKAPQAAMIGLKLPGCSSTYPI